MELKEFLILISEQFLDEDIENVTEVVEFRTLETWDSLTGMAILAIIEDECNVSISIEDFIKLKTVKDLFNYVYTR